MNAPGVLLALMLGQQLAAAESPYFEIQILDADSGRGIPMVELETVHRLRWISDSAGRVAFNEPGLLNQEVFFSIRSPGYEVPKDGFGYAGARWKTVPGTTSTLRLKRRNIAERLYRITGAGIYRDSVLLEKPTPLTNPVLNAGVLGQDSVQAAVFKKQVFWFWGDTNLANHPLGHFGTAGATSALPAHGGLDPERGVDLEYFVNAQGHSRPVAPLAGKSSDPIWLDGVCVVPDSKGEEQLFAHYSRMKSLSERVAHGLAVFDAAEGLFKAAETLEAKETWRHPAGQAERHGDHVYFGNPFPIVRVPATAESVSEPKAYEIWSEGEWRREGDLRATLKSDAFRPLDIATRQRIRLHGGSVRWNSFRQRWVLIAVQDGGTSPLGEVWYSEADAITGPWPAAAKILTHENYSFYNPCHHPFFDGASGRVIYFDGTYSHTFSGNRHPTPGYDYNQIMYRLDLEDPRLAAVRLAAKKSEVKD